MDENRIKGAVRNVEGKVEETVGGLTGDTRTKLEGKLDQDVGKVQSAVGRAMDELGGTAIADRAASLVRQATAAGENAASVVQNAAQKAGSCTGRCRDRLRNRLPHAAPLTPAGRHRASAPALSCALRVGRVFAEIWRGPIRGGPHLATRYGLPDVRCS
jgi:uncharacterized protein YjbJ (UPF0337 family)